MESHEKAVKDGLDRILKDMKQDKVTDLNRSHNEGVRRGETWFLKVALVLSFCAFCFALFLAISSAYRVEGKQHGLLLLQQQQETSLRDLQREQGEQYRMQQKIIMDEIALMKVKHDKLEKSYDKLKSQPKEVNEK